MANPVSRIIQVGVQEVAIWPWSADQETFTDESAEYFYGLQSVDFTINSTEVEGYGGESVFSTFAAEVKREVDVKTSAFDTTFRALQIMLGGDLTVDPASGQGGEVQIFSSNLGDRAPAFRMRCKSTVGNGNLFLTFPKLRLSGSISWNMRADGIHMPEFGGKAQFDKSYQRQDGKLGAPYELFYGDGDTTEPHS